MRRNNDSNEHDATVSLSDALFGRKRGFSRHPGGFDLPQWERDLRERPPAESETEDVETYHPPGEVTMEWEAPSDELARRLRNVSVDFGSGGHAGSDEPDGSDGPEEGVHLPSDASVLSSPCGLEPEPESEDSAVAGDSASEEDARALLSEARDEIGRSSHGEFHRTMAITADLWADHLGINVDATTGGELIALHKIARARSGERDKDHYLDAINYLAAAYSFEQNDRPDRQRTL